MSTARRPSLLLATLSAALLSACSLPTPAVHEVLQISADGHYLLQGQPVQRAELPGTLDAEQHRVKSLMVEISASPASTMDAVTFSVQAARQAHVRVAFVQENETL